MLRHYENKTYHHHGDTSKICYVYNLEDMILTILLSIFLQTRGVDYLDFTG